MGDLYLQRRFWKVLQQIVFDCYYYHFYGQFFAMIIRGINTFISIMTIIATGILVTWCQSRFVQICCPSVISILQILRMVVDQMCFETKEQKLRNAYYRSKEMQTAAERTWGKVVDGSITKHEIEVSIYSLLRKRETIANLCFENDYIPENKLIKEKAESKAESYISGLVEDMKNEQSKDDESKDE